MKTSKGELSHTSFPSPEATEWRLPPLPDPLQTSGLDPLQILCVLQPCSQGFFLWTCWSSELCYSMEASPWISAKSPKCRTLDLCALKGKKHWGVG